MFIYLTLTLPKSNLGELPAVERQRGGVEEKQPSAEEHEHVGFGRFCCTTITNIYPLPGTSQKTSQGR